MKLKDRLRAASRAFRGKGAVETGGLDRLMEWLGIDREHTAADALSEATYYACLKVLSESLGKLPLRLQRFTEDGGIEQVRGHPYYQMLGERPNRYMTASTFWSTMEFCRNHHGNSYAWIDTRNIARPQMWPMNPTDVTVYYDDGCKLADVPDVYYQYSTPQGVMVIPSEDVLHFKAHQTRDGLVGIPVRHQLADTIQGNIKAQRMTNEMYDSGMTAKAVLQYTGGLDDAKVQTLVKGVEQYAQGKSRNTGVANIIPIPVGFALTPLNVKLADSQFLEVKQYSALQIASAFGVKPYQVGDYTKSSYASAEAQQLSFLVDTLTFNIKQYEEEVDYKLLSREEVANGLHSKYDTSALLRTDQRTMIETLSTAVNSFLLMPNEARARLDLPAVPGGWRLLGNGSSIPVDLTGAQYANTTPVEPEATEDPETPPSNEGGGET